MASLLSSQRCLLSRQCNYHRVCLARQERRWLNLAHALHKPQGVELDPARNPIIIMHGLFGSKQNSRSVSK